MSDRLHTGGDVDAFCTKCKMDLTHTIVAMVEDTPVQVKCNTCHTFHRYRAPKSAPKRSSAPGATRRTATAGAKSRTEKARTKSAASAKVRWEGLLEEHAETEARRYNVKETWAKDDIILHPTFGTGVVLEQLPGNKIRVIFEDSERILIHRHGQPPIEQADRADEHRF